MATVGGDRTRAVTVGEVAYVDESMRQTVDAGHFVLAVVRVPSDVRQLEERLRRQLRPGQLRWHWRNERASRRVQMLQLLADLHPEGVQSTVVHVHPVPRRRQRNARVTALWTALDHLAKARISELVIESRQEPLDADDRREIACAQRTVSSMAVPYRHASPRKVPGLWLADAVAGAIGEQLADSEPRWSDVLPPDAWDVLRVHCS